MKFTALEISGVAKIQPVAGCTTCPHVNKLKDIGTGVEILHCRHDGKKKKLIGSWAGAYHASCQLPTSAEAFTP